MNHWPFPQLNIPPPSTHISAEAIKQRGASSRRNTRWEERIGTRRSSISHRAAPPRRWRQREWGRRVAPASTATKHHPEGRGGGEAEGGLPGHVSSSNGQYTSRWRGERQGTPPRHQHGREMAGRAIATSAHMAAVGREGASPTERIWAVVMSRRDNCGKHVHLPL